MAEPKDKIYRSKKVIFFDNLIGGVAWAMGATIGLAIILAILGFVVKNINLVPIVGNFVSDVMKEVLQKNPQLLK